VREGEGTAIEIDARLHAPIDQSVGIIRASKRQDAARSFVEFLMSEEGQSVLKSVVSGSAVRRGNELTGMDRIYRI
jgi:ABC-type molybdate transport system substrate-binding protein